MLIFLNFLFFLFLNMPTSIFIKECKVGNTKIPNFCNCFVTKIIARVESFLHTCTLMVKKKEIQLSAKNLSFTRLLYKNSCYLAPNWFFCTTFTTIYKTEYLQKGNKAWCNELKAHNIFYLSIQKYMEKHIIISLMFIHNFVAEECKIHV